MIETSDSEFYRALLRAYIDSANDGIFVLCDEMKFLVANPLLESWLAVSEANLTQHNQRRPIIATAVFPLSCWRHLHLLGMATVHWWEMGGR